MGAAKKKRGQQRKAAAKDYTTATNNDTTGRSGSATIGGVSVNKRQVIKALNKLPQKQIVEMVQKRDPITTYALSESLIKGISYQRSGILESVLNFLGRCEFETFEEVMGNSTFVGERLDLVSPSIWIKVLIKADEMEPKCALQIAENISPLVRSMCADTKRLFFGSNKHWVDSFYSFVTLISSLLSRMILQSDESGSTRISEELLSHGNLLKTIVQWGYWGEHRPDIMKDLRAVVTRTVDIGKNLTKVLVRDVSDRTERAGNLSGYDEEILNIIGTTPVINKEYDPNCMVSHTEGLIRQLKKTGDEDDLTMIHFLISNVDCVDKKVITEWIDLGTNFISDFESARRVMGISQSIIFKGIATKNSQPSDTRVAFAIRAGLVNMCLLFLEKFGGHESFENNEHDALSLSTCIRYTFEYIHEVSLQQKTAKAIRSKKSGIEDMLVHIELNADMSDANFFSKLGMPNNATDNPQSLLDMVKSILNLNGSYCCRCNKSLSRTEVKQCNGCHQMTYCSIECQRDDWLNGHKLACCSSPTMENIGQFQGRMRPRKEPDDERAAGKLKELETNMNMIQLKLFLDNARIILSQARGLDTPLYDCIVTFDLRECPPIVTTRRSSFIFDTPQRKGFEESRSIENITCVYHSFSYNGELDGKGEVQLFDIQRLFPHEWLVKQTKSELASIEAIVAKMPPTAKPSWAY